VTEPKSTESDGSHGEAPGWSVDFAVASDRGTERGDNEDACGTYAESPHHVVIGVADGVSGEQGGEVASQTAVEVTLRTYEESTVAWGPLKRLYRAMQQANIEIHDRALVVTELRRMSTTMTAFAIDAGTVHAGHVGDSRLYLVRAGAIEQKTKDHTVVGERRRMGLISAERARHHPDRSVLTRSLGRELIAAIDRLSFPLSGGDVLIACSDGLHNVLADEEMREIATGTTTATAAAAVQALLDAANGRGTYDNVTVAIVKIGGQTPEAPAAGLRGLFSKLIGR
jgi:protein phosphatase